MLEDILDKLVEFQHNHPNLYIGGSVSLMLQEAIPLRKPKDVDIISKEKIQIHEIFNLTKRPSWIKSYNYDGIQFEIFNNPNAEYIEYNHNGNILKLSPIQEILNWKLKRVTKKHYNDLKAATPPEIFRMQELAGLLEIRVNNPLWPDWETALAKNKGKILSQIILPYWGWDDINKIEIIWEHNSKMGPFAVFTYPDSDIQLMIVGHQAFHHEPIKIGKFKLWYDWDELPNYEDGDLPYE